MRAGNQEERRSARRLLFYATTSAAVPDLAAFDSRLPHIRMSFRDGPKDQARNLEIPGSRGACHRARIRATRWRAPEMTSARRQKRSPLSRASFIACAVSGYRKLPQK